MRAGFTGTQQFITTAQWVSLVGLLNNLNPTHCHHGDCIGADRYFHEAARLQGRLVVLHPPLNAAKREFCTADEYRPEKEYLERNKDIVRETDVLIAVPKSAEEELRSGTWSTVRFARKLMRPICIIPPSGAYVLENWGSHDG